MLDAIFLGSICGIFGFLIYNFLLFIQYKEKNILDYVWYLLLLVLYLSSYAFRRNHVGLVPNYWQAIHEVLGILTAVFYVRFIAYSIKSWKNKMPKIYKWLEILFKASWMYCIYILIMIFFVEDKNIIMFTAAISLRSSFAVIGFVAIPKILKIKLTGFERLIALFGAIYFIIILVVLVCVIFDFKHTIEIFLCGCVLEVILFSYAMSNKIKETILLPQKLKTQLWKDLHDEIGSELSGVRILTELLAAQKNNKVNQELLLSKINHNVENAIDKFNTLVWAMNDEKDTIKEFIDFVKKWAYAFIENTPIELHFLTATDDNLHLQLNSNYRKNLLLIIKELFNNSVKHAQCTHINLNIGIKDNTLLITYADNGLGFDISNSHGNGLNIIKQRVGALDGEVEFNSINGFLAKIKITFFH